MKLDIKKEKNKILCIGDIILDTYLKGDVNRISPEAPIPVLKLSDEINTIGGCGNVSRNICSAGGFCHLISVVGNDLEADVLKNLLNLIYKYRLLFTISNSIKCYFKYKISHQINIF